VIQEDAGDLKGMWFDDVEGLMELGAQRPLPAVAEGWRYAAQGATEAALHHINH
jgi:hypothetical protein